MHRELGTILIAGPAAAGSGLRVEGARVVDVLPTVLHLLGQPVAADLDGEPARWMLAEGSGRGREPERIATYETGERPELPTDVESPVDDQIRERVEALGYVE
jgi:hypothetical protein